MLFKILGAPVTAPLAGFKFILHQIQNLADQELFDEHRIHDDLLLLNAELDDGEISEEEFLEREAAIMVRLREARARREQAGRS
jgi:hypothetical protein